MVEITVMIAVKVKMMLIGEEEGKNNKSGERNVNDRRR